MLLPKNKLPDIKVLMVLISIGGQITGINQLLKFQIRFLKDNIIWRCINLVRQPEAIHLQLLSNRFGLLTMENYHHGKEIFIMI